MPVLAGAVIVVVLIAFAAYIAACETSLMRVSRIRVRYLVEKDTKNARKLERLLEQTDYFYPTILLLALAIQTATASLATSLMITITGNTGYGVAAGTLVITIMMFIFGELVPKAAASHNSERVALAVTNQVLLLTRIFSPVVWILEKFARFFLKLMHMETGSGDSIVSEEGEIKALVTVAEQQALIEEDEKDMIHSVFEFSDTIVREVMVPRPDIVALPTNTTMENALDTISEHGFSRIPVYEELLDNIIGILYAKDIIAYLRNGGLERKVEEIVRKPIIVPETKVLSELLREMKSAQVHMTIVIDEYGTVVGIATIEDLLEEIVGEIFDEYDNEIEPILQVGADRYRVNAGLNLDDLAEELEISIERYEGIDSVGGLVLKSLGHLPSEGETIVHGPLSITVDELGKNRIRTVTVSVNRPRPEDEDQKHER